MKIFLFDMDGTLTEARKQMGMMMCASIARLQNSGYRVGIVTGSNLDYIKEQCKLLFDFSPADYTKIDFYPCNGTKHYTILNKETEHYNFSIEEKLGQKGYSQLIYKLTDIQASFKHKVWGNNIPLTGNFIDCRGSMINYCPIGRKATMDQRKKWIDLDRQYGIRSGILEKYFGNPAYEGLEVNLGGETSFDITPLGWNKTFVMRNFKPTDEVWFIGDKCTGLGNDKALYDLINKLSKDHAFETTGPKHTIELINNLIFKEE